MSLLDTRRPRLAMGDDLLPPAINGDTNAYNAAFLLPESHTCVSAANKSFELRKTRSGLSDADRTLQSSRTEAT